MADEIFPGYDEAIAGVQAPPAPATGGGFDIGLLQQMLMQMQQPQQATDQPKQMPTWLAFIPGGARGFAQRQQMDAQQEELKLRKQQLAGQEAMHKLQQLQLMQKIEQQQSLKRWGGLYSSLLANEHVMDPQSVKEVEGMLVRELAERQGPDAVQKFLDSRQTAEGLKALNALDQQTQAPAVPQAGPGGGAEAQRLPALTGQVVGKLPNGRPIVRTADGGVSTHRTITEVVNGKWYNFPTMFGGKEVSPQEAIALVQRNGFIDPDTGEPIQAYPSLQAAEAADRAMHAELEQTLQRMGPQQGQGGSPQTAVYEKMAREYAQSVGVDPNLAVAVMRTESSGNPNAVGDGGRAVGLFQLHPAAAQDVGLTAAQRKDPQANVRGGVDYLKKQLDATGGNVPAALQRYNGGGTADYAQRVMAQMPAPGAGKAQQNQDAVALEGLRQRERQIELYMKQAEPFIQTSPKIKTRYDAKKAELERVQKDMDQIQTRQQQRAQQDRGFAHQEQMQEQSFAQQERMEEIRRKGQIEAARQQGIEAEQLKENRYLTPEELAETGQPFGTRISDMKNKGVVPAPRREAQLNALDYGSRANSANEQAKALEAQGITGTPLLDSLEGGVSKLLGGVGAVVGTVSGGLVGGAGGAAVGAGVGDLAPALSNYLRSEADQLYFMAKLNFIGSVLRKESGAAVTAAEYDRENKRWFPLPGDAPAVIKQKAALREERIKQFAEQTGRGLPAPVPPIVPTGTPAGAAPRDPLGIR